MPENGPYDNRDRPPAINQWRDRAIAAEAEVERLRAERDQWKADTHVLVGERDQAEAEVRHLRALLREVNDDPDSNLPVHLMARIDTTVSDDR